MNKLYSYLYFYFLLNERTSHIRVDQIFCYIYFNITE